MTIETIRVKKVYGEGFVDVEAKDGYPAPKGERSVVYNGYETDEIGIIWCEVDENKAGYMPMVGRDELAAPWYLAQWENFETRQDAIESANRLVDLVNAERGISPREQLAVIASSMRMGRGLNMADKKTVHWELPSSAADTIMETLAMDSRSSMFDMELRQEIGDAGRSVKWRCQVVRLESENTEDLLSDIKGIIDGTDEGFFSADDLRQAITRFEREQLRIDELHNTEHDDH